MAAVRTACWCELLPCTVCLPCPCGQAPFVHNHVLEGSPDTDWTGMVFSDDDRFIALSCSRGIILVDAFQLQEVGTALLRRVLTDAIPSFAPRCHAWFADRADHAAARPSHVDASPE